MSTIVSIILLVASIGMFFGYIDPTYAHIRADLAQKSDYDTSLNNSKQLETQRDALLQKYNAMSADDLAKLQKLLPDNIDNIRLVIDVDNMAKTYGMRIRNFKTDTGSDENSDGTIGATNSPYGTLTLSFDTTATYPTFLAFMHDLERSLRIMDITSVKFTPTDSNPLYDYTVTLNTYWLK